MAYLEERVAELEGQIARIRAALTPLYTEWRARQRHEAVIGIPYPVNDLRGFPMDTQEEIDAKIKQGYDELNEEDHTPGESKEHPTHL